MTGKGVFALLGGGAGGGELGLEVSSTLTYSHEA